MGKIEFLLMLISVFVALSYIPARGEAKETLPRRRVRYQRDA